MAQIKLHDHIRVIRGRMQGSDGYVVKINEEAVGFLDCTLAGRPLRWIRRTRLATDVEVVGQILDCDHQDDGHARMFACGHRVCGACERNFLGCPNCED